MRIIHLIPYFPPATRFGGAPEAVFSLVNAQAELGHEIHVITGSAGLEQTQRHPAIDMEWLDHAWIQAQGSMNPSCAITYLKNAWPLLADRGKVFTLPFHKMLNDDSTCKNADLIHFHEANIWGYKQAARFAFDHAIPCVISPHGSLAPPVHRGAKRWIHAMGDPLLRRGWFKNLSGYISLCEAETRQFISCGIPQNRITAIPYGCPVFSDQSAPFPYELPASEVPVLLCLGRISAAKGIYLAFDAFQLLWKKNQRCRLIFCGHDEGDANTLREKSRKSNIPCVEDGLSALPGVSMIPSAPRLSLPHLFSHCAMTLCPSPYESFGLAPIESILCGTPVIATDAYGCLEHITAAPSWMKIAEANTPEAFADCISDRVKHGKSGLPPRPQELLPDWKTIAKKTIALYQSMK